MIRPRNALKTPILQFLTNSPESTGREISNSTGEEIHNVHNALLRLFINRLVIREKGKTKKSGWQSYFIYSITQKGQDRLIYYETLKDWRGKNMTREKLKDFVFDSYIILIVLGQAILLVGTIYGIVVIPWATKNKKLFQFWTRFLSSWKNWIDPNLQHKPQTEHKKCWIIALMPCVWSKYPLPREQNYQRLVFQQWISPFFFSGCCFSTIDLAIHRFCALCRLLKNNSTTKYMREYNIQHTLTRKIVKKGLSF